MVNADRILLAMHRQSVGGVEEVTAPELIVCAWEFDEESKKALGLDHFNHPDSNKVLSYVMGSGGLVKRGYMIKVRQKVYKLSDKGIQAAQSLLQNKNGVSPRSHKKYRIEHKIVEFLDTFCNTTVFQKCEEGFENELTFRDYCIALGIVEYDTKLFCLYGDVVSKAEMALQADGIVTGKR